MQLLFSIKLNSITFQSSGQYSPAICLIIASYTGCDRVLTVFLLTLGVGLNGAIYSGFKINHLGKFPMIIIFFCFLLCRWHSLIIHLSLFLLSYRYYTTICRHFNGIHKLYSKFSRSLGSNRCWQSHRSKSKAQISMKHRLWFPQRFRPFLILFHLLAFLFGLFSQRCRNGKSYSSLQPVFTLHVQHFTISSVRPNDRNGIIHWMMRRPPFPFTKSMAMVYKWTVLYKQMVFHGHRSRRYWATDKRNWMEMASENQRNSVCGNKRQRKTTLTLLHTVSGPQQSSPPPSSTSSSFTTSHPSSTAIEMKFYIKMETINLMLEYIRTHTRTRTHAQTKPYPSHHLLTRTHINTHTGGPAIRCNSDFF